MKHVVNPAGSAADWAMQRSLRCGCVYSEATNRDLVVSVTLCSLHVFQASLRGLPIETAEQCRAVIRELVEFHPASEAR